MAFVPYRRLLPTTAANRCVAAVARARLSSSHPSSTPTTTSHSTSVSDADAAAAAAVASPFIGNNVGVRRPTAESYFPWRVHTPREKRIKDYVMNWVARAIVADWLLSFQSDRHPSSSYMEIDFLLGCQQAFRTACAAIFNHEKLARVKGEPPTAAAADASTATATATAAAGDTAFVPTLPAVLEKHLAQFYESAVMNMSRSTFHIHHEIGSIGTPTIESYDVVFGGKRGEDFGGLVRRDTLGIIGTIGTEKGQSSAEKYAFFSDLTNLEHVPKEVKNLLQMRKYATVRLGVNIPVTETFYVRDEVTGAVIQGSTEPSRVVHNLLLESLLEAGTHGKFSDWEVCDLDGWVEGNEFWVESKKVVNTKGTTTSSSSGSSSPSP